MTKAIVGIVGGSGIYDLPGLEEVREERADTPWGEPSAPLRIGRIGSTEAVFLPRHGPKHRLSPSTINYRANIAAMKQAGVTDLIALSACGSYRAELYPGLFVLVDQFVDRTHARQSSFFGDGLVAHVSMAHPVAPRLVERIAEAAKSQDIAYARGGTYVCIEGPQFSSRAESLTYKSLGYDVVGMTSMPEAKLAREAEIAYASVAMITDYDCWHEEHGPVDVAAVLKVLSDNAHRAQAIIGRLLRDFPQEREACPVGSDHALDHALITPPEARDPELVKKLGAIASRVLHPTT
ncbi:MAG: S-methyl-5'-thioadenosine phosphorylase [Methylobacteriaceae bacterium]|nr:S-methyl-5'-thioadenosine phosphorylase [Methylobacteriaceae bacterium]